MSENQPEEKNENNNQDDKKVVSEELTNEFLKEIMEEIRKEDEEKTKKLQEETDNKLKEKEVNYKETIKEQIRKQIEIQKTMDDKFGEQQQIIDELKKQLESVENGSKAGTRVEYKRYNLDISNKNQEIKPEEFDYENNKVAYDEYALKKFGLM